MKSSPGPLVRMGWIRAASAAAGAAAPMLEKDQADARSFGRNLRFPDFNISLI